MFSHGLRHDSETNRCEVVDGESGVLGVVGREDVDVGALHAHIRESLCDDLDTEHLRHLLQEELDEDTTGTGRVLFVHLDDVKDTPRDGVGCEEVSEEAGDVAKATSLVTMNCLVVVDECCLVGVAPDTVDFAEALSHETVELAVGLFLG